MDRFVDRFMSNVEIKNWGCWIWIGAHHERGYGRVRFQGKVRATHRVAYEVFFGERPPDDRMVLHRCDEPRCVNPDHLYLGTQLENMRDRIARNRVPRSTPRSLEEALSWIEHHEDQKRRIEARISLLREFIDSMTKRRAA